jgi:hypothetical protein
LLFLLTFWMRNPRCPIELNLNVNLGIEWWAIGDSSLTKHFPMTTTNNHSSVDKFVRLIIVARIIPYNL